MIVYFDTYCCDMMERNATCETDAFRKDKTVFYSKRFDEYIIPLVENKGRKDKLNAYFLDQTRRIDCQRR